MSDKRLPGVMRGVSPCMDCTERHTACHDTCSQYKAWKAEVQDIKDKKKEYENKNWRKRWRKTIIKPDFKL